MKRRYSCMKVFHFRDKVDSLPRSVDRVLAPVHIRIKPTNACNHNCAYCAYRADALQLGRDMQARDRIPRDKMREIVEDIIAMQVRAVTFSGGGEPFCYPHLLEAVQALAASPVQFAALTNGARLSGELAELFAHRATWVRVSMDGWDGASYARYRRVPETEFDRVTGNMAAFQRLGGGCRLGASLIVDRTNAAHVREFIGRMRALGVDSVKVSPCIVANDAAANNAYHAPVFDRVKDEIARAKQDFAVRDFEVYDAYHALEDKFAKDYTWCPYLQVLPVIGADCRVYACQDKAYNLDTGCLGSIADRRFAAFWFDGKDKFFRIDPSKVCDHHCVANEKNRLLLEYLEADPEHLAFV